MVQLRIDIVIIFSPHFDKNCSLIWSLYLPRLQSYLVCFIMRIAIIFRTHDKNYCNHIWSTLIDFSLPFVNLFVSNFKSASIGSGCFFVNINLKFCSFISSSSEDVNWISSWRSLSDSSFCEEDILVRSALASSLACSFWAVRTGGGPLFFFIGRWTWGLLTGVRFLSVSDWLSDLIGSSSCSDSLSYSVVSLASNESLENMYLKNQFRLQYASPCHLPGFLTIRIRFWFFFFWKFSSFPFRFLNFFGFWNSRRGRFWTLPDELKSQIHKVETENFQSLKAQMEPHG